MNSNNDDEDDFGDFDQEETICCSSPSSNYLMVQNISALAGKLQTSLTVSDATTTTNIPPVKDDDHVISEAIAQWEALCQRENNPAYQISSDVMDTVARTVEYNREKICEFYYGIVDSLDTNNSMDRRIVAIAMSYLKRYVERCGKSNFNLLLMTSLFLAM